MSEFTTVPLEALADSGKSAFATGPFGSAVSSRNFQAAGVPMLRGSNLSDEVGTRLNESDLVYLSEELANQFVRSTVRAGDLIFTCWGTVGQIGFIDSTASHDRYVISNKQMKLTVDRSKVDPLFLYYYLSQDAVVDLVRSQAIGSSVPGFNLGQLRVLPVSVPRGTVQRAIAEVLGALDDKIAANTKLARTADALAAASFKAMLPGALGRPLSDAAEFINGKAFTKGASGTGRVVIRIAELNSGIGGSTVFNDIDVPDEHLARPGDLLFAWSGSLTLHRWYRPEAIVNQHIFKVVPIPGFPLWLVYELLRAKLDDFKAIAANKATTMGHIQRRHLDEPVLVPESSVVRERDEQMTALWEAALSAERENLMLATIRDTLLPELMSGRLRVKDAEAVAESVL